MSPDQIGLLRKIEALLTKIAANRCTAAEAAAARNDARELTEQLYGLAFAGNRTVRHQHDFFRTCLKDADGAEVHDCACGARRRVFYGVNGIVDALDEEVKLGGSIANVLHDCSQLNQTESTLLST